MLFRSGLILSVLTVRLKPQTDTVFGGFAIPILLLATPLLDTCVAVTSRLQNNLSPFQGGQDHLSHRLLRIGFSKPTTAIILWTFSAYFTSIAIAITFLNFNEKILLSVAIVTWLLLFRFFITKE